MAGLTTYMLDGIPFIADGDHLFFIRAYREVYVGTKEAIQNEPALSRWIRYALSLDDEEAQSRGRSSENQENVEDTGSLGCNCQLFARGQGPLHVFARLGSLERTPI